MPYLRHSSPADNPAACSFSTLMICSSVNLLLRMSVSLGNGLYPKTGAFKGSRSLEAWLLADHKAITKTFRFKKGLRKIANPESINRPKEFLRDIIRRGSNNRVVYVNTVHNVKIAQNCT